MPGPPFCRSCGAILAEGTVKCPSCGAPQGPAPRRQGFSRASTAGLMLMVLFGLALFQGIFVLANPDLPAQQPLAFSVGTFRVNGTVLDPSGSGVGGVNVSVVGRDNETNVTDPDGAFVIPKVAAGYVELLFSSSGHPNATLRMFLFEDQHVVVHLPAAGGEPVATKHSSYRMVAGITQACGVVWIGFGGVCLLGSIASYRRRNWGLALAGAICGLFVSVPLSLVLGAIAILLVSTGRPEFQKRV